MKISKLIKRLESLKDKHGDLEIDLWSDKSPQSEDIAGISIYEKNDEIIKATICGLETMKAFDN